MKITVNSIHCSCVPRGSHWLIQRSHWLIQRVTLAHTEGHTGSYGESPAASVAVGGSEEQEEVGGLTWCLILTLNSPSSPTRPSHYVVGDIVCCEHLVRIPGTNTGIVRAKYYICGLLTSLFQPALTLQPLALKNCEELKKLLQYFSVYLLFCEASSVE